MPEPIKRRNLALWIGFVLLLLAALSISLFFVDTALKPILPWLSPLLCVAALIVLLVGARRAQTQPAVYSGKAAGWTLASFAFVMMLFGFFFLYISRHIPSAHAAPHPGQKAPEFALSDSNGQTVSLAQLLSGANQPAHPKAVLLVFYRGYW